MSVQGEACMIGIRLQSYLIGYDPCTRNSILPLYGLCITDVAMYISVSTLLWRPQLAHLGSSVAEWTLCMWRCKDIYPSMAASLVACIGCDPCCNQFTHIDSFPHPHTHIHSVPYLHSWGICFLSSLTYGAEMVTSTAGSLKPFALHKHEAVWWWRDPCRAWQLKLHMMHNAWLIHRCLDNRLKSKADYLLHVHKMMLPRQKFASTSKCQLSSILTGDSYLSRV